MSRVERELEARVEELRAKGDDAQRLELVQRARRFKRSWVEMAEGLVLVRDTRAYERWGYEDLYDYCAKELQIRAATVDKLTGSYSTLRAHAPQVLQRDGVASAIPTIEAVDYFARALAREPANDPEPEAELMGELHKAVFDEARPLQSLRRQFNPLLNPKPEGVELTQSIERTRAASKRLRSFITSVEGLSEARVEAVSAALEALEQELAALLEQATEDVHATVAQRRG
jgi:hypothetical protein